MRDRIFCLQAVCLSWDEASCLPPTLVTFPNSLNCALGQFKFGLWLFLVRFPSYTVKKLKTLVDFCLWDYNFEDKNLAALLIYFVQSIMFASCPFI